MLKSPLCDCELRMSVPVLALRVCLLLLHKHPAYTTEESNSLQCLKSYTKRQSKTFSKVKWPRYMLWMALGGRGSKQILFFLNLVTRRGWVVSITPPPSLPPRKGPTVSIVHETGWAPEPVWSQKLEQKSSASVGVQTPIVQSAAKYYTDWATQLMKLS
jgi:hypothetical protein